MKTQYNGVRQESVSLLMSMSSSEIGYETEKVKMNTF